jgi:hypothetical protein
MIEPFYSFMVFPKGCGIKSAFQIYQAIDNDTLKKALCYKSVAVG